LGRGKEASKRGANEEEEEEEEEKKEEPKCRKQIWSDHFLP
jgi:hypothetical protein